MFIGIAATYVELNVQATALDVVDNHKEIVQNLHMDVMVDKLLGLIDKEHMRKIGCLQWIKALTRNIPSLYTKQKCLFTIKHWQLNFEFLLESLKYIHWQPATRTKC
jgi:hypothetical protein